MRIALLDDPDEDGWALRPNRFDAVARVLAEAGHAVVLVGGGPSAVDGHPGVRRLAPEPPPVPILTGLNHALETAPLTRAHDLVRRLADLDLDLIVSPLAGGLAHGVVMARTCGEAFGRTRIALWLDRPTRAAMLASDDSTAGLRPLVADALERAVLARADVVLAPDAAAIEALAPLGVDRPPVLDARLPPLQRPAAPALNGPVGDLVFVGRLDRDAGAVGFIAAVETLDRTGRLAARGVVLHGPHRRTAPGPSAAWLGLRAAPWRFPFALETATDPLAALDRVDRRADTLAVIAVEEGGVLPFALGGHGRHLALSPAAIRAPDFAEILTAALAGSPPPPAAPVAATDWPTLAATIAAMPQRDHTRPRPAPGVAVVVLHKDRPQFLPHALASLPADLGPDTPFEVIVVDNGSTGAEALACLDRLASERPDVRVLRLATSIDRAAAYGEGVAAARHGTVVFLDDDNVFAADGVARLAGAVIEGRLDVVVSTLDVFDHQGAAPSPGVARLVFIGEAGSAGLFFNAFGDTALAIRRDLFQAIGGFPSDGGGCPSLDWVMLAAARAAGARIGVLQQPATRYRRDTVRAAGTWLKYDRENARSRVFAAYGGRFDGELVTRWAQKRHIDDI